jgi:hypothetical protein
LGIKGLVVVAVVYEYSPIIQGQKREKKKKKQNEASHGPSSTGPRSPYMLPMHHPMVVLP